MPNRPDVSNDTFFCDACVYEPYTDWIRANGRPGKCPIHGQSTTVAVRALSMKVDEDFRKRYQRAARGGSDWDDLVKHEMMVCDGKLIDEIVEILPHLTSVNAMDGDEQFYHGRFERKETTDEH